MLFHCQGCELNPWLKVKVLVTQWCLNSLQPHELSCSWNSPGKNTGVCSHSLLQGIFPTQGSNPGLLYCRQTLYGLSYVGSPMNDLNLITSKHQTNVKQEAFYKWTRKRGRQEGKKDWSVLLKNVTVIKEKKELFQIKDIQTDMTIQQNAWFGTFFSFMTVTFLSSTDQSFFPSCLPLFLVHL